MLNKQAAALTVEQVQARFQQWRRQKQGRAAIPDELWAAAIALARRDGVNRTAAALRLDGSKLKGQMTTKVGTAKAIGAPPSFVALLAGSPSGVAANPPRYTIELDGRHGRLRVHCQDPAELATVSRTLWDLMASS